MIQGSSSNPFPVDLNNLGNIYQKHVPEHVQKCIKIALRVLEGAAIGALTGAAAISVAVVVLSGAAALAAAMPYILAGAGLGAVAGGLLVSTGYIIHLVQRHFELKNTAPLETVDIQIHHTDAITTQKIKIAEQLNEALTPDLLATPGLFRLSVEKPRLELFMKKLYEGEPLTAEEKLEPMLLASALKQINKDMSILNRIYESVTKLASGIDVSQVQEINQVTNEKIDEKYNKIAPTLQTLVDTLLVEEKEALSKYLEVLDRTSIAQENATHQDKMTKVNLGFALAPTLLEIQPETEMGDRDIKKKMALLLSIMIAKREEIGL